MKIGFIILAALFFFNLQTVFGFQQTKKIEKHSIDSLLQGNPKTLSESEIDQLLQLSYDYRYKKPDSAIYYSKIAESFGRIIHYDIGVAKSLFNRGHVYVLIGKFGDALEMALEGLRITEPIGDEFLLGTGYHLRAITYQQLRNDSLALVNFELAKSHIYKAGTQDYLMNIYNNSAVVLYNMGRYEEAKENYLKSLDLTNKLNSPLGRSIGYNNMAWVSIKTNKWEDAKAYLDSSMSLGLKMNIPELNAWIYQAKSEIFLHENQFKQAELNGIKALEFAKSVSVLAKERDIEETLSRVYEAQHDGWKAFQHHKRFKELSDSLFNEEIEKKTTMLQLNYEFEKKELDLINQQKLKDSEFKQQISTRNWIILASILTLLGISVLSIFIFNSRKLLAESNEKLSQANLEISRQHDILEEANNSKNKLFSIISHDLRGPMGNLWLSLEEALNLIQEKDVEQAELFVSIAIKSAQNSFELLENLLHWSRNQLEAAKAVPEFFEPYIIVDDSFNVLKNQYEQKDITIGFSINSTKQVFADKEMMRIVIRNCISNAIKFTPKSGSIIVDISEKTDSEFISIRVIDSGVGMSPEKMNQLFNFVENQSTRGTNGEIGTGLGLVLANELTRMNKGKIHIESEINKGTTVEILLPTQSS